MRLTLGFSSCPNDTLIFYSMTHGKIDQEDFIFEKIICDVETLNEKALRNDLDVTKVSVAGYLKVKERYELLNAGAAMGRNCGPLVVTDSATSIEELDGAEIAIPGKLTTAYLLFLIFLKENLKGFSFIPRFMNFDRIIPSIKLGQVRAGIIIHESRFTYKSAGLYEIIDLGRWWEGYTGLPVPLGVIIARRDLGADIINRLNRIVRNSVIYGLNHLDEAMEFIKSYSQELSEEIIMKHINLYVNEYTIDISDAGRSSIEKLAELGEAL